MSMPGMVGPWKIAPGQVTDDSELAMSLLCALSDMDENQFDSLKIAKMYKLWYLSEPFDMCTTTMKTLGVLSLDKIPEDKLVQTGYKNVTMNFEK